MLLNELVKLLNLRVRLRQKVTSKLYNCYYHSPDMLLLQILLQFNAVVAVFCRTWTCSNGDVVTSG